MCYNTKEQRLEVEGNFKKWKKQRKKLRRETVVFSLEKKNKKQNKNTIFPLSLSLLKNILENATFGKINMSIFRVCVTLLCIPLSHFTHPYIIF